MIGRLAKGGVALLSLALVAACSDGTSPRPLIFRYELARVDDMPLPAVIYRGPVSATAPGAPDATCENRVLSRRLELGRSGRYTVAGASVLVCDDGRPDLETPVSSAGTYTLSGDVLTLTSDASRFDGSITLWQGPREGLELRLQQQLQPGGAYGSGYGDFIIDLHTYVYRAVP